MALLGLLAHDAVRLTVHEAFSGIFGAVSVACWVFLLLPQLYENYKAQSGESVSLAFLSIWMLGDVTNLIGAVWAGLVPTVIALGVHFCITDGLLIGQCMYYKVKNRNRHVDSGDGSPISGAAVTEHEPLLPGRRDSNASHTEAGLPGAYTRRKSSAASAPKKSRSNSLAQIPEDYSEYVSGTAREVRKNVASVAFVFAVGALGWLLAWQIKWWKPQPEPGQDVDSGSGMPLGAEALGYLSAVAYLSARLPQIYKNYRAKSCEGLSLLFFILSLIGNLTYGIGAQILAHSLEREYFLKNLPWLIGSWGTILEDATIFAQFRIYGDKSATEAVTE